MSELKYFALVAITALASLVALCVSYWYIFKQDAVVITAISGGIGYILGYVFKILEGKIRKQG